MLAASVLHLLLGRRLNLTFAQSALFCTLGYATHGLLDALTSYGTVMLWPFSEERFAWRIISVVDPLFTLPIIGLVFAAVLRSSSAYARAALVWGAIYLTLATLQQQTALKLAYGIAESRGHVPTRIQVKPSFGNILVWKTLYEAQDRFFVDAVRVGLSPRVFTGDSIPKLNIARDLPWLDSGSQQARDIERFRWFSDGYISQDPAHPNRIIDVRYSLIPNQLAALWSIEVALNAGPMDHARFLTHRGNASHRLGELWRLMFGGDG